MDPVRRAVIDVGTNSIKLLVADVAGRDVQPVFEESKQTRLGEGFYEAHRLQPGPIAKTAQAVADFAGQAQAHGAAAIRVIATSAARDAVNSSELTAAVQKASGLGIEIISGDVEADWAFRGVTTDSALARQPLMILDVGGGSTEFILGEGGTKYFSQSFPLGTVRLMQQVPHGDPPTPGELADCRQRVRTFLQCEVQPRVETEYERLVRANQPGETSGQGGRALQLVGTGGTASILGCMEAALDHFDRARLEATRLSFERLRWHVEHLWGLPLGQRKQVIGLPPNRADVILTGVAIYEGIMECFSLWDLRISTRGLRFAAVLTMGRSG
jgi:exopolyphosphatase/guanosine-5'-triphosphate,3'-diphosphate pyrophosphatase